VKKIHVFEILEYVPDFELLINREREIVNETLISDPSCMNLKIGGLGGFWNEEHQKKAQIAGAKAVWKMYPEKLKENIKKARSLEAMEKRKQSFLEFWQNLEFFRANTHSPKQKRK
jgi:hypothetical protein